MNKQQKIALCLIVKPTSDEADVLYRLLSTDSLHLKVDGIFITITCKEGDPAAKRIEQTAQAVKAHVSYFPWVNDFAAARNFNFTRVSKDYEWIFWVDADDIVKGSDQLREVLNKLDNNISGLVLPYLYDFDEDGVCNVRHNKIRVIRNDGSYVWVGKLHEDLCQQRETMNFFSSNIQILHLTNAKRLNVAIKRNLEISKEMYDIDSKDARSQWNYANSLYMAGKLDEAIEMFFRFIECSGSEEEIYLAWERVSQIYFTKRDLERSIEAGLEALRMRPWYPNAYFTLAYSFFDARKFKHAKEMLLDGLRKRIPDDTMIVWNPRDYDYNPLSLLAKVYFQLGEPKESYLILQKIIDMFPQKKKTLQEWADEVKKIVDNLERVDKIGEKVLKCRSKKQIKKLLDNVPDDLRSHPKLCHLRNIHFIRKSSTGKDVSIYCFQTAEIWNPESVKKTGIGGSEEAVINVSNVLSELGYNVTVYNSCGHKAQKFGKVLYRPFWEYNPRDKTDITIAWRSPILYDHEVNSTQKYVWLHDTVNQNEFTRKRLDNFDKIFVLSDFHRSLYPGIENEKFVLTSNGLLPEQFDNWKCPNCSNTKIIVDDDKYLCEQCGYHSDIEEPFQIIKRIPGRMIYTSAPERGLDLLLNLWPEIRKKVPEATLAVYYGWTVWDAVYTTDQEQQEWKKKILELLKQPGIVSEYKRISHEEIAKEMMRSEVFVYPSEFSEINCISLQKAQAAGAIPVTTDFSAVKQMNVKGIQVHGSDIYTNKKLQEEWLNQVIKLLKDQKRQEKIRKDMISFAKQEFSWKKTCAGWDYIFKNNETMS